MLKEKDILSMYVKRVALDSFFYFATIILITVFYQLSTEKHVEVIYPYSIAITIYLTWMCVRYISYRNFYHNLNKMEKDCAYDGRFAKEDDRAINQAFNQVHREYLQLIQSKDTFEEEQRRFLSAWIHSMKTPVTVESLIIQRVNRKELDKETAMEEIALENDKLLSSLDMVLNIMRLQEFAKDYKPEEFDLAVELNQIINNNKRLFIYSNVFPKVINECGENMSMKVLSDCKWNRHMIEQLISNVVKYSKKDEAVTNLTFRLTREGKKMALYVEDEGIGIEETDLPRVFEPFFTGENGRNGRNSSGVGLYFCKEISEHIQCELSIESNISKGTKVKVLYLNYPSYVLE